jgi:hypothetical protein
MSSDKAHHSEVEAQQTGHYVSLRQDDAPERVFCWVTRWDDGTVDVESVDAGCEDGGIEYIRADIHAAEIRRLEDIIAQMSDELVDAWEACEEAVSKVVEWQTSYQSLNAIRHKIVEEREYWQEMYQNTSEALRKTGDRLLKAIDGGAL